jgi:ABC-type multidrug transport system permease subunit
MLLRLPLLCLGSLLLLALLSGVFTIFQLNSTKDSNKTTAVTVGVVAAENEPFVDWMISTISSMKNTKYTCTFERLDADTADAKLKNGEVAIVFLVPQNYIASFINGENKHLTIRFGKRQTTIVSFLFRELSHAASCFILDTEAGIYSMQEYYRLQSLPNASGDERTLNLQYIKEVVSLDEGIETEEIPAKTSYPLTQQYVIAALVLFLFLWGTICGRLLAGQRKSFANQLKLAGIGRTKQTITRWLAFFITALANYLLLFALVSLLMAVTPLSLPDTLCAAIPGLWLFALYGIPLLLLSTAFIQLVYEIAQDAMSGLLFLFFAILFMGLCSGCFYPLSYLPQTLQQIAPVLPVYQAEQYGLSVLNGSFSIPSFVYLLTGTAFCLGLIRLTKSFPFC